MSRSQRIPGASREAGKIQILLSKRSTEIAAASLGQDPGRIQPRQEHDGPKTGTHERPEDSSIQKARDLRDIGLGRPLTEQMADRERGYPKSKTKEQKNDDISIHG